ncbi:uncharacterized protein [Choristoneura fumiferana]|uniref:uncharacterized protein n=1 Tax=Choristoneura fumiferana TaxID=7141 RepID=UPI003D1587B5
MHTLAIFLSVVLSSLYSVSGHPTTNYSEKEALRYGFQQTHECKSFEKSFLCVRKCLDKNYDIAVSDKNCKCTCYLKKDKAKYKNKNNNASTWVGGAPSTHLPRWYQTTGTNDGQEDSGETTENIVTNYENDSDRKTEPGRADETGETVTGVPMRGETGQANEAAQTGETEAPHEEETHQAEDGGTGTAAEGETGAPSEGETEAAQHDQTPVPETEAPPS